MLTYLGLVTALMLASPTQASTPPPALRGYVVVDGKKDPSRFPEWVTWEHGFAVLAAWTGKDSGFNHDLKATLTAEEYALLEKEVAAQHDRQAAAAKAIEQLRPIYEKADPKDQRTARFLDEQQFAINLTYRRAVLAARDRLLASLGPTSQSALVAWMDDGRSSITVYVPKGDLAHWRAPE
jgi:hypothetical protein